MPSAASHGSAAQPVLLLAMLMVAALTPLPGLAQRAQPQAPASGELYQPDQQTCTPERQLAAFNNALGPYADQPPAVLERLRDLQRQLSARSLRSCLEQGLLSPEQVETLMTAMGIAVPSPAPQPQDSPVLADPKPAQVMPAAPRPAAPDRSILRSAPVKPATRTPRSAPSTAPKPSAFDMSPIERNPARSAPIDPETQDNPSSPR